MKTTKLILESLIVIFLLVAIYFLYINWKKDPIPEERYKYSTITIYQKVPYPLPTLLPIKTPPKVITIYEIDTTALDSLKILLREKDIVIQGLSEEILISHYFLKQYPQNPKLVELNLKKDSISLALLHINGRISKYDYPIYLNEFNYRWVYSDLSHIPIKLVSEKIPWNLNYYSYIGYNIFPNSPYLSIQANLENDRVKFSGEYGLILLNENPNYIKFSFGYKLFNR